MNVLVPAGGCGVGNLTEPVAVSLRHWAEGADPMAAWWNQDGPGGWSSEGCKLRSSQPNVSSLYCQHLGNVAVLMVCIMVLGRGGGRGGVCRDSGREARKYVWEVGTGDFDHLEPQESTERTAALCSADVKVHGN